MALVGTPSLPIAGSRVVLRAPTHGDVDAMVRLATDSIIRAFLGGPRDPERTRASVLGYLQQGHSDPFRPVVADARTNRMVGEVELSRREADRPGHTQPGGLELELSYVFLPEVWGKGYAAESARLLLGAFAECLPDQDVLVVTQAANFASVKVAERLGFKKAVVFEEFNAEQWLGVVRLSAFGSP